MNEYDTEYIASVFLNFGFERTEIPDKANYIILNTCSVREKPEHKVFSELGKFGKLTRNSNTKIGVCGCVAQQEGENIINKFDFVHFVIGTDAIYKLDKILEYVENGERVVDTDFYDGEYKIPYFEHTRNVVSYVSIMKGCNNFCSYCVVPYLRGREKSRDHRELLDEVKRLIDSGAKEITFIGQNVNSYGKSLDENVDFPKFLYMVNDINGLERIRFITSHPKDFSDELLYAMRDLEKVCEFLHLPLQSGSDEVLGLMKRCYTYEEYKKKLHKAKELIPEIAFSSDFIIGFPGESDNDFLDTINAVEELRFDSIFAFKYSPRAGTSAYKIEDNVSAYKKKKRLDFILKSQSDITYGINKRYIGEKVEVMVEGMSKRDTDVYSGRNRQNKVVNFQSAISLNIGDIVDVLINDAKKNSLFGELKNDKLIKEGSYDV